MYVLITLAAVVSIFCFANLANRFVAFLLAVTTTFTLWIWLVSVLPHPLVNWKEHFVTGALLVAALVAIGVGGAFEVWRRLRQR